MGQNIELILAKYLDTGYSILDTDEQHPASSIQHPASSDQHPASSIQHPASSIQHRTIIIAVTASSFDEEFTLDHSTSGFEHRKNETRANRLEWEHIVPAQAFGQSFIEWTEGHPDCIDSKGETYKGRKCASKANEQFELMEADMYNLVPAIGEVNGDRSNYGYATLQGELREYETFTATGSLTIIPFRSPSVIFTIALVPPVPLEPGLPACTYAAVMPEASANDTVVLYGSSPSAIFLAGGKGRPKISFRTRAGR